jgi:hemoglobin
MHIGNIQTSQPMEETTLFDAIGGAATFERIVERFYQGVATDPVLRPLYPEDLTESKRHLALFLMQYFGGPTTYSQERGHPRLRMRHLPFTIGQAERDAWMRHMKAAVEAEQLPAVIQGTLLDYFERVATFMMNR